MIAAQKEQLLEWAQIIIDKFRLATPCYGTSLGQRIAYLVDISLDDKIHKLIIYHTGNKISIRHRYRCDLCQSDKTMPCCIAVHINLDSDDCPKRIDVYDCRCLAGDNDVYGTVWNKNNDLQDSLASDFTNAIPLLVYILEPVVHATEFEMGEYITI